MRFLYEAIPLIAKRLFFLLLTTLKNEHLTKIKRVRKHIRIKKKIQMFFNKHDKKPKEKRRLIAKKVPDFGYC